MNRPQPLLEFGNAGLGNDDTLGRFVLAHRRDVHARHHDIFYLKIVELYRILDQTAFMTVQFAFALRRLHYRDKLVIRYALDLSELEEICRKLDEQEKANINSLTLVRDKIKKELNKTSKNTKLVSAYSGAEAVQGKILDFRE